MTKREEFRLALRIATALAGSSRDKSLVGRSENRFFDDSVVSLLAGLVDHVRRQPLFDEAETPAAGLAAEKQET